MNVLGQLKVEDVAVRHDPFCQDEDDHDEHRVGGRCDRDSRLASLRTPCEAPRLQNGISLSKGSAAPRSSKS